MLTTPLAVIAVADESQTGGERQKDEDQSGVAGLELGCCLSVVDGVRVQRGAPVADALIRANAVDVLQEGKKKNSPIDAR